eukprot:TRINITY_DN427_c1_g1_i8.p1 TRINITY_DN427_c1_g1~~TRINITY_DN427_c1_g1_i8.p1  ORF type:complete len:1229 (-),score=506.41 TRINITY_DN427_c1_g1_i8:439-4125(-)
MLQDRIHHPGGLRGAGATRRMARTTAQVLVQPGHMVLLDVRGVGDVQFQSFVRRAKHQRLFLEYREDDLAGAAGDLDPVGAFETAEMPAAAAGDATVIAPAGRYRVTRAVETLLVGAAAGSLRHLAKKMREQVQAVAGQVIEIATGRDARIGAPAIATLQVVRSGCAGQLPVDVAWRADAALDQPLPHLLEARQRAPVVGHEQRLPGGLEGVQHLHALLVAGGHGLFDAAGFASGSDLQGVVQVGVGRGGDIEGVDVGIVDQCIGIAEPARYAVTSCVVGRQGRVASHDRDQFEAGRALVGGTTLFLGDCAAADDAPADRRHAASPAGVAQQWASPPRASRMGQSGRWSPWQPCTSCSRVVFMACNSPMRWSSSPMWVCASCLTLRLGRDWSSHKPIRSLTCTMEKPNCLAWRMKRSRCTSRSRQTRQPASVRPALGIRPVSSQWRIILAETPEALAASPMFMSSLLRMGLPAAQQQGIADHADAGEGHRRPCQHGIEHAQCRQRDADQVVDERPEQVLADLAIGAARDVDGVSGQPRVAMHQGDAGRLHGHIGAGGHGDADVGGGQRRGIVDAVADHRHHARAVGTQRVDGGGLVARQHLGAHVADAQFAGHALRSAPVVAAEHDGGNAQPVQGGDGVPGAGLDLVAEGQQAQHLGAMAIVIAPRQPGEGAALLLQGLRLCRQGLGGRLQLLHPATAAQVQQLTFDLPLDAQAGHAAGLGGGGDSQVLALGSGIEYGAAQRVFASCLQGRGQRQQAVGLHAGGGLQIGQARPAHGQGAGLVEGDHVDAVGDFQRLRILDQDAVARRYAGAGHDGRGRGQAQGAGAGDHHHRHRIEQGLRPVASGQAPAQQRHQRQQQHGRHEHRADLVHQALDRCLGGLGLLHHAHDARQHGLGANGRGLDEQGALGIDGAGGQRVAGLFGLRVAFAGQHGFIQVAAAFAHHPIDRHPFTRTQYHHVTHAYLGQRHLELLAVAAHAGAVRAQGIQGRDGVGGLALGAAFQPFAQQDQGDDHGRAFEVQVGRGHAVRLHVTAGQPLPQRQPIGSAGAQRDQQVHIARTRPQRAPAGMVEAPAQPELHGRGQQPLPQRWQVQAQAQRGQQHGQYQRQRQRRRQRDRPPGGQGGAGAGVLAGGFRRGVLSGMVAGLFDGGDQGGRRGGILGGDAGALGGKVDADVGHAGDFLQGLFDPRDAGGAAHAFDIEADLAHGGSGGGHGEYSGRMNRTASCSSFP